MRILKSRRIMLLLVMLLLVALLGAAGVVSAAPTVTNVTAQLNPDYKIVVDGVNQNLFNSTGQPVYPLVYNNSTYLPLRAMGELMNKNVNWDEANLTASLEGKRTANTISSTYAAVAQKYGAEVTGVDDLNQTFELLTSGRIDATLNADVSYHDYMRAHPEADIKIACLDPDPTQVAIPMRKGEDTAALREGIDKALAELAQEGVLTELSIQYFGMDISQAQIGRASCRERE